MHKKNKNEICMNYKLSNSTIMNIMREFELHIRIHILDGLKRSGKIMCSAVIKQFITKLINNNHLPFSSRDVIKAARRDLGISQQIYHLINYMKENMNISFKKSTSRPSNLNRERQQLLKWLFSRRLTKRISSNMILININESSFLRSTKINYSWIWKVKHLI